MPMEEEEEEEEEEGGGGGGDEEEEKKEEEEEKEEEEKKKKKKEEKEKKKNKKNSTGITFKQKVLEKWHGNVCVCVCIVCFAGWWPATVKMVEHVLLTHQHQELWCHFSGRRPYKNIKEDSQTTSGHAGKVICLLGNPHRINSIMVKNYHLAHPIS